jgi:hypothetical protein
MSDTKRLLTDAELTAEVERMRKLANEKIGGLTPKQVDEIHELMNDAAYGVLFIFEKVLEEHPKVDPRNVLSCLFLKMSAACLKAGLEPAQLQIMVTHAVAKHEKNEGATVQ